MIHPVQDRRPNPTSRTRLLSRTGLPILLVVAGCNLDTTNPSSDTAWTAQVEQVDSEDPVPFVARAAMVSGGIQTAIAIEFLEAPLNEVFGWFVRFGTCGQAGVRLSSQLNVFPLVAIDLNGEGDALAVLPFAVSRVQDYAVVVTSNPLVGERVLGCGDLVEVVE